MDKRQSTSRLKHLDFMVLDILCLQLCFTLSFWMNEYFGSPYANNRYQYLAVIFVVCQLVVMLVSNNYQGILRRGMLDEAIAVGKFAIGIALIAIIYLFLVQQSVTASRMQFGCTFVLFLFADYLLRQVNKLRIRKFSQAQKKSLVLITSPDLLASTMEQLCNPKNYHDYIVSGIILLGNSPNSAIEAEGYNNVPVKQLSRSAIEEISHGWVDEVFIMQPGDQLLPPHLMDDLLEMGMTVNYTTESIAGEHWPVADVRKLGGYRVLTSSIHLASAGQTALKRIADIIGGIIGCIITVILFAFVAPAIYAQSPGPIFFKQERVGR